jgi:hypothetical protein
VTRRLSDAHFQPGTTNRINYSRNPPTARRLRRAKDTLIMYHLINKYHNLYTYPISHQPHAFFPLTVPDHPTKFTHGSPHHHHFTASPSSTSACPLAPAPPHASPPPHTPSPRPHACSTTSGTRTRKRSIPSASTSRRVSPGRSSPRLRARVGLRARLEGVLVWVCSEVG